jgi:hypothetical protein
MNPTLTYLLILGFMTLGGYEVRYRIWRASETTYTAEEG